MHEPLPTKICALISRIPPDTRSVLGGLGETIASSIEVLGLGWVGWLRLAKDGVEGEDGGGCRRSVFCGGRRA